MDIYDSACLIPGLPAELGLECLTRLPPSSHRVASAVCRRWRNVLRSSTFYYHRKKWGFTRDVACLVQSLPSSADVAAGRKLGSAAYGISVFDPVARSWERLESPAEYPDGLPLFCQVCGSDGKLVVMGGWSPASYHPVASVFVYDFAAGRWRQGRDMPTKRSFFAVGGGGGGTVYVAGGHDLGKNALRSAWAYDVHRDEWRELAQMSRGRDECEGAFVGAEFWVVSGYGTERQGAFDGTAEAYDPEEGTWRVVEGAWEAGRCPRSRVAVGRDGKLACWGDLDSGVRVGSRGVAMGTRLALVSGTECEGASPGIFLVDLEGREGQKGKVERVDVEASSDDHRSDVEFCGFVQSGCCVEI